LKSSRCGGCVVSEKFGGNRSGGVGGGNDGA
jgi:hypothetical protein